eukprot:scaffold28436_cov112-Isochrysis_galbana.AAC.2
MASLGKFAVLMADPPWDIHMELPYGTMSDDEMRRMNVQVGGEEIGARGLPRAQEEGWAGDG